MRYLVGFAIALAIFAMGALLGLGSADRRPTLPIDQEVEVGLLNNKGPIVSFSGKLLSVSAEWVTIQGTGGGALWVPRGNVSYLLEDRSAATRPTQ